MKKNEHENDISIGKDQWIEFGDIEDRHSEADIDDAIKVCSDLWNALETECVAACCGIDAFALWKEDIQKVTISIGKEKLLSKIVNMKSSLIDTDAEVFVSNRLNNYFLKSVFMQLIEHIEYCAMSA